MYTLKKSSKTQALTLAAALIFALLLALPTAGFSWGPGDGDCSIDHFAQRSEAIKEKLNLDETQNKLWDAMKTGMIELLELSLQKGDNLNRETRRRTKVRNFLLMRAELAAEKPDFKAVGEKLKAEYKGSLGEKFNQVTDARVAFFSSLSQQQRDIMIQKGHMRPHHGNREGKGRGRNSDM
ncbi:MAG: hypothetical protein JXR80_03740 [Deltaproteobacteria bacterium]|nr:hypothetical protein [Deltaproteobacteria bacterium]